MILLSSCFHFPSSGTAQRHHTCSPINNLQVSNIICIPVLYIAV